MPRYEHLNTTRLKHLPDNVRSMITNKLYLQTTSQNYWKKPCGPQSWSALTLLLELCAEQSVFPAKLRKLSSASFIKCLPRSKDVEVVLKSIKISKGVVANVIDISYQSLTISGNAIRKVKSSSVYAHYNARSKELTARFKVPSNAKGSLRVTGYYHVAGIKKLACFSTVSLPVCP